MKVLVIIVGLIIAIANSGCSGFKGLFGGSDVVDAEDSRGFFSITQMFEDEFGYPEDPKMAWSHLKGKLADISRESETTLLGGNVELAPETLEKAIYYCIHHGLYLQASFLTQRLEKQSDAGLMKALQAKAFLAEKQEEDDSAIRFWKNLLNLDITHRAARVNLGRLYTEHGHFEQALETLHPLKGDSYVSSLMMISFRHLGMNEQADIICAQEAGSSSSYELRYNCGLHHFQAYRDAVKAISFVEGAVEDMPDGELRKNAEIVLEEMKGFEEIHY